MSYSPLIDDYLINYDHLKPRFKCVYNETRFNNKIIYVCRNGQVESYSFKKAKYNTHVSFERCIHHVDDLFYEKTYKMGLLYPLLHPSLLIALDRVYDRGYFKIEDLKRINKILREAFDELNSSNKLYDIPEEREEKYAL